MVSKGQEAAPGHGVASAGSHAVILEEEGHHPVRLLIEDQEPWLEKDKPQVERRVSEMGDMSGLLSQKTKQTMEEAGRVGILRNAASAHSTVGGGKPGWSSVPETFWLKLVMMLLIQANQACPFHWRWPAEYQELIQDGIKNHFKDAAPQYRVP
jgi:hypothetical protein